ncbi:MAG: DUF881 domain-containing protein [Bacillota bacterium]
MIKSQKSGRTYLIKNKLLFIILFLLLINTALIVFGYFLFFTPTEDDEIYLIYKRELADALSDYNYRLAGRFDVYDLYAVREALADYNHALEMASSSDEIIKAIVNEGFAAQNIIYREAEARLEERVLIAVNNDARVRETLDETHLLIRMVDDQVDIVPEQFLDHNTVKHIQQIFSPGQYSGTQVIDIIIFDGAAKVVTPQNDQDQLRSLSEDLEALRTVLHDTMVISGLAEMVGPGISLLVYDAEDSTGSDSLVHDADVRDLVNELFSAGAKGVSVGNQRLTATSAVRCSGPLIMVNYRQIPTNPVVIEAVGDPDLLISGLDLIISELNRSRGLKFEISTSGFIKLPGYIEEQ